MSRTHSELSFTEVDGLGFAAANGKLYQSKPRVLALERLGPLLEVKKMIEVGLLPSFHFRVKSAALSRLLHALNMREEYWYTADSEASGFAKTSEWCSDYDNRLTALMMRAKRAAQDISGLSENIAGMLIAAIRELESNIHEHAYAPTTGIIAYQAERDSFEFVISDHGIGILTSLQSNPEFSSLLDSGTALTLALKEGVSRYGVDKTRGFGFRPIFVGLLELFTELRFRSDDHAVTMDGVRQSIVSAQVAQKVPLRGFFASVRCYGNAVPE